MWLGCGGSGSGVGVKGVRFIQNGHIYKNDHNWGRKWVPRHDSGGIRREFDENLNEIPPGIYRPHIIEIFQYWGWKDCHKFQKWS